ncbi:MAG TPA: glycosyltransferase family 4 protein [Bryobacteraceae bacterium]|nr:glycosyltransferase family 4 protein [Bryobacteraceae bacterium]
MRILHLDAGREMRGGQWQVLRLIEGLDGAGVQSTLLAPSRVPLYEAVRKRGWRVEDWGLAKARRLARNHDVVHAHDARGHTLGALTGGPRLVVSRRVAFVPGRSPVSRWKYARAARYIAVSEFVKSVLIEAGVPEEKVSVVYDGVPVLEPGPTGGTALVLSPASADPQKGAELAGKAAQLAGVTLEFSADLERDLPRAALLLYVTYSEGLGSGALLAMSAGVPVVASRVGGLAEVIRHGENGMLADNAPEAIAAAMRQVLDHPALAQRMGTAARQTVLEQFTVDRMVRRTMEVYRKVLD